MNKKYIEEIASDFIQEVPSFKLLINDLIEQKKVTEFTKKSIKDETDLNILFVNNVRGNEVIYATINHDNTNGIALKLAPQLTELPKESIEKIIALVFAESLLNDWQPCDYLIPDDYVFSEVKDVLDPDFESADLLAETILKM